MTSHTASGESGSQITYHAAPLPIHHSGVGLASLIVGVLSILFFLGFIGAGIFAELNLPGGVDGVDEDSLPFAIAVIVFFLGYGLACAGIGLGIGVILHSDRKRTLALLGLSLNGFIVVMLTVAIGIGILVDAGFL